MYEYDEWYIYKDENYISYCEDTLYETWALSEQELKDKLLKVTT